MSILLRFFGKSVRLVLCGLTTALFVITAVALFFGTERWWSEITTHFIHLYFLCAAALLTLAFILKDKIGIWLNTAILVSTAFLLAPYYLQPSNASAAGTTVKLLHFNPQAGRNRNYSSALTLIKETDPDVIAISEVESEWQKRLNTMLPEYPHKIVTMVGGGLALLSKYPFTSSEIRYAGIKKRPRILVTLPVDGVPVNIVAVHPLIPLQNSFARRNAEIKIWTEEIDARNKPTIVLGDFNSSPWSPFMRTFLESTELKDSALGFGVQPSWPVISGNLPTLTPIDNCYVSRHFMVLKRNTGPDIGSDHLPILVTAQLNKQN